MDQFISESCKGQKCRCGEPAVKKIREVIMHDDPNQIRHPFTQYVCEKHFDEVLRPYLFSPNKTSKQIGGYAPGGYVCHCCRCGVQYLGDKRSFQCARCANEDVKIEAFFIEVLQFLSDKHEIKLTGQQLLDEYRKYIYNTFIKEYRDKK